MNAIILGILIIALGFALFYRNRLRMTAGAFMLGWLGIGTVFGAIAHILIG